MKKQHFLSIFFFLLFHNGVYLQNAKQEIYVMYSVCDKIRHEIAKDSTFSLEYFELKWNEGSPQKKLQIKKNTQGNSVVNIQQISSTQFNIIKLQHTVLPKDIPQTISKKELFAPNHLVLYYADFCYFDKSLLATLQASSTVFLVDIDSLEAEMYKVKKALRFN